MTARFWETMNLFDVQKRELDHANWRAAADMAETRIKALRTIESSRELMLRVDQLLLREAWPTKVQPPK
jgi:hypothetical protein